jgi:hypothetical protein
MLLLLALMLRMLRWSSWPLSAQSCPPPSRTALQTGSELDRRFARAGRPWQLPTTLATTPQLPRLI